MKTHKRWTEKERQYIKKNYKTMKSREMAVELKRTTESVSQQLYILRKQGFQIEKVNNRGWTKEEDEELDLLIKSLKVPEISKMLGRTTGSVYSKITSREERERGQERTESSKSKEQFENEAYKRLISEPVTDGIFKRNLKVELGKNYRAEKVKGRISKSDDKPFTGKLIHETKDHLTLKSKTRAESFLKVDFLTGEYKIKEGV